MCALSVDLEARRGSDELAVDWSLPRTVRVWTILIACVPRSGGGPGGGGHMERSINKL
jgi:hypothetical protein